MRNSKRIGKEKIKQECIHGIEPRHSISAASTNCFESILSSSSVRQSTSRCSRTSRRKHDLTEDELKPFFGMRQKDAAKELKCSHSTLKRICARIKISWPFKKNKNKLPTHLEDYDDSYDAHMAMDVKRDPYLTAAYTPSTASEYHTEWSGVSSNEGFFSANDMPSTHASISNTYNDTQYCTDYNRQRSQSFAPPITTNRERSLSNVSYMINASSGIVHANLYHRSNVTTSSNGGFYENRAGHHPLNTSGIASVSRWDNHDQASRPRAYSFAPFTQILSNIGADCEQSSFNGAGRIHSRRSQRHSARMSLHRDRSASNVSSTNNASRQRFYSNASSIPDMSRNRFYSSGNPSFGVSEQLEMYRKFPSMEHKFNNNH